MSFRVTDPETSVEAFRSLEGNHDCLMILAALVELDRVSGSGANAFEIQHHLIHQGNHREINSIGSRLNELAKARWAEKTTEERPGRTNRPQTVWRPTMPGREQVAA